MTSQFPGMTSSSSFFWRCSAFLVNFSYWSKFHVNIIIGSGAITISFHKGLTRNPEFRNTPVWVLPYTLRLGKVRNTKFGTNVSSKMLFNDEKCQVNSFCGFWVIKGKPTGGKITPIPPPRLRLIYNFRFFTYLLYFFFFKISFISVVCCQYRCLYIIFQFLLHHWPRTACHTNLWNLLIQ